MSRTYKKPATPNQWLRHPKGKVKADREKARPGSIPPDSWDDIPLQKLNFLPAKIAENMLNKGCHKEEVVKHIMVKFKMKSTEASYIVNYLSKRIRL